MNKTKKILIALSLIAAVSTQVFAAEKPAEYKEYNRLSWEQMQEITNPNRLGHRIFYKASQGPDAKWFDAVKKGDLPTIKAMVAKGQNLEAKDEANLNQTALGWAAFIGYMDIVEYLVDQGADLYATDKADVTSSFKSAVLGGNIQVIKYLYPKVKDHIDLDAQDERDDETALMVAVWNDRKEAVEFLIEKGAKVNIYAKKIDENALSYAYKQNNLKIAKILLDAGADLPEGHKKISIKNP